jgi:hypothetical protein
MKRLILLAIASIVSTTVISTFPSQASADNYANNYINRISNQQQRINQGIRNGSISPREYTNLSKRENALKVAIVRDTYDGRGLTSAERYRLNRRADNISRSIYVYKRN